MTTVVSIQARMGSSRLPGKVLLDLAGRPILDRVVSRCRTAALAEEVAVTIGNEAANAVLREWCRRNGVRCLSGPEDDLLRRHRSVSAATDARTLVRVTGDSPLLPGEEIDRLVRRYRSDEAVYATNHTGTTPHGMIVDVVSADVLAELADRGETHPTASLRAETYDYATTFSADPRWEEIADADLEVDTPDDYWRLTDAINDVGSDPLAVGRWLLDRSDQ